MPSCAAADFQQLVTRDPLDRRIGAALAPAVDPLNTALSRTPALSNAVTAFLGSGNLPVRAPLLLSVPLVSAHRTQAIFRVFGIGFLG